MTQIYLPEPRGHQAEVLEAIYRYKVLRVGRRGGKTRAAFIACCAGHGSKPNGRGMLQGGATCWIPSTNKQGKAIWREEILPRFRQHPAFTVNETDKIVTAPNGGTLELISAEGIDAAQGRRFDGVFFDEPRDYDLFYIWSHIIRPTLVDRRGWAMFGSTTRAYTDFNALCAQTTWTGEQPGPRGDQWYCWHWTTMDNPALPPEEFAELAAEYDGKPIAYQEEILAKLLTTVNGLAFPEFVSDVAKQVHVVPTRVPPRTWTYVGGLDWGYVKGCYSLAAIGPEGQIEFVYERILEKEHAQEAALACLRESARWPTPEYIAYDIAMDADAGVKIGTTLTDEWYRGMMKALGERAQLPRMVPVRHTQGSRPARKNLVHRLLKYGEARNTETGWLEPWALPRVRFQQQCQYLITSMSTLPIDPKDANDVDTTQDDHGYDCLSYLCVSQPESVKPDAVETVDVDKHPGYDRAARRRRTAPWERALRAGQDEDLPQFWTPGA